MYKLKKGELRTVIYNTRDLDLYRQAGWSLVEDELKETPTAQKDKIDEQDNNKRKSIKK